MSLPPVRSQPDALAGHAGALRPGAAFAALAGRRALLLEVAAVALIVLAALLFRTVNLSTLPAGFHGDEAVVGLEARRILDEGEIGVYSRRAAGQPTGPIYLVAPSIWLFGQTVFAVRIVPALLGTLTVLALYIVLRRNFGIPVALVGASVLAAMNWHIHFARLGFPLEAWPLVAVLLAGAAVEAVRDTDWRWWAAAGALTALGIYVYNAHPLLAATVMLFLGAGLLLRLRAVPRRAILCAGAFGLALLIVLLPMIRYATSDDTHYWVHFKKARITDTEEWQALDGRGDQARFIAIAYRDVWDGLCCGPPEVDLVDGTGFTAITPKAMLALAGLGVLLALRRPRSPLVYLGLMVVLIMPLGAALSEGGLARRTLAMAPFLAMFCGLACARLVEIARSWGRQATLAAATALTLVVGVVVYQNLDLYFDDFADPEVQAVILGKPISDAARFLDEHGEGRYVYFYSGTWSIDYVTMEYLAPEVEGEDRSEKFGIYHFRIDPDDDRPLFVFIRPYLDDIEEVKRRYPGVEITPVEPDEEPTFRVYLPYRDTVGGEPSRVR